MKKIISIAIISIMILICEINSSYAKSEFSYVLDKNNNAMITAYNGSASSITIPNQIDGYKVTKIGQHAFNESRNKTNGKILTNVVVSEGIIELGDFSFVGCTSLNSITLPESLNNLGFQTFVGCTNLSKINIPSKVEMLTPNVFQETNISEIIIPENVKEIGSGAFRICKNLKKVTINSKTLKISDDAFEYCNNDLVLYGYEGSTTQKFANNKKIKFSKITSANTELNTKQNESVKNTSSEIKILLNEKQLKSDVAPIIENGRTLVPLRAILEDLGAQVTWDVASRTATAKTDKYTLYVTIGSTNVKRKINATNEVKNFTIDTAAKIKDGRTLVPVRFMAELLDKNVQWNSIERNVIITG